MNVRLPPDAKIAALMASAPCNGHYRQEVFGPLPSVTKDVPPLSLAPGDLGRNRKPTPDFFKQIATERLKAPW